MNTIIIDSDTYNQVKAYADDERMSVDAFVIMLIKKELKNNSTQPQLYRMKSLQELSPEVQSLIGLVHPVEGEEDDMNGSNVKYEYLREKYGNI